MKSRIHKEKSLRATFSLRGGCPRGSCRSIVGYAPFVMGMVSAIISSSLFALSTPSFAQSTGRLTVAAIDDVVAGDEGWIIAIDNVAADAGGWVTAIDGVVAGGGGGIAAYVAGAGGGFAAFGDIVDESNGEIAMFGKVEEEIAALAIETQSQIKGIVAGGESGSANNNIPAGRMEGADIKPIKGVIPSVVITESKGETPLVDDSPGRALTFTTVGIPVDSDGNKISPEEFVATPEDKAPVADKPEQRTVDFPSNDDALAIVDDLSGKPEDRAPEVDGVVPGSGNKTILAGDATTVTTRTVAATTIVETFTASYLPTPIIITTFAVPPVDITTTTPINIDSVITTSGTVSEEDTGVFVSRTGEGYLGLVNEAGIGDVEYGIKAVRSGVGDINIVSNGEIRNARKYGIFASHAGTGRIDVDIGGEVKALGGNNLNDVYMSGGVFHQLALRPGFVLDNIFIGVDASDSMESKWDVARGDTQGDDFEQVRDIGLLRYVLEHDVVDDVNTWRFYQGGLSPSAVIVLESVSVVSDSLEANVGGDGDGRGGALFANQQSLRFSRTHDGRVYFGFDVPSVSFVSGDLVVGTSMMQVFSTSSISRGGIGVESHAVASFMCC